MAITKIKTATTKHEQSQRFNPVSCRKRNSLKVLLLVSQMFNICLIKYLFTCLACYTAEGSGLFNNESGGPVYSQ
jgi:hypothetical protein